MASRPEPGDTSGARYRRTRQEIVEGRKRSNCGPWPFEASNLTEEMETIVKRTWIILAGGCLAALLVAGCNGVSPNSTTSPLGGVAQSVISVPGITPHGCGRFDVRPKHRAIRVNVRLPLYATMPFPSYVACNREPVDAHWRTSRGGRIQPSYGVEAIFYAVRPGVYRVRAKYKWFTAGATVTVTSQ